MNIIIGLIIGLPIGFIFGVYLCVTYQLKNPEILQKMLNKIRSV